MEEIFKKGTDRNPFIHAKVINNNAVIKIYGRAHGYSDEAEEQLQPLINWIAKYCKQPKQKIQIDFWIEYMDEPYPMLFTKIIEYLDNYKKENGKKVTVNWYHGIDNEASEEDALRLKAKFRNINFNILCFVDLWPPDTEWPDFKEGLFK